MTPHEATGPEAEGDRVVVNDTWERLTSALRPGSLKNQFAVHMPLPDARQLHAWAVAEGERWASWGAARDGARILLTRRQKIALLVLGGLIAVTLLMGPHAAPITFIALVTVLYFITGIYKFWLLVRGERARNGAAEESAAGDSRQIIPDDDLPAYTVLVPLHREGRILPVLINRLQAIDYPPDRLQILLLIELDDEQTRRALTACQLPAHIRPLTMPPGQPRTKPRALNVGLSEAVGEFIVIYDAEDHPEPDQLRKAVAAFRRLPESVVCAQARLNFYNRHQSLLARLFAVDYAVWYDQLLAGLAHTGLTRSGVFVPLGGTSNHFRVPVLRRVGGWDPFNVTEDCDLGTRLGRAGLRVAMLDSITWEEAVTTVRPWIRQRSRWVKGYMQTYLVHMRHPARLLRQVGLHGFVDFQMLVGGSSLVLLINPLMWGLMVLYIAGNGTSLDVFIETLFPPLLYYPSLLCLTAGNFIFYYINAYVCVRHDYITLTRYALLTPFYWLLLSMGAWAGLLSLIRNPYYWAKTEHGVSMREVGRFTRLAGD